MRLLAEPIEAELGQRLVIMARPGAGGNLGAQEVLRAPADGYTLLLGATNNFVINQFLFSNMNFDPLTSLVPIAKLADVPSVLFTHPSVPATTMREFIAYAKANPGKIYFGSPSFGTTPHLSVERLKLQESIDLTHLPFQGSPAAVVALLRNDIQLYLGGVAVGQGHIAAGTLRPLAVSSPSRLAALPEVPTLTESGISDFGASNGWVLAAAKGTPQEVVDKLHRAVMNALTSKGVQERFAQFGFLASRQTSMELATEFRSDAAVWAETIKKANIKLP